jgi:molybdate transport system substrate-binding protein
VRTARSDRGRAGLVLLAATVLTVTACGANGNDGGTDSNAGITVFAAASLRESFTELADRFERENPGTVVVLNVAGSSDLATQISEGAPVDVFASADTRTMERVQDAGLIAGEPVDFATNTLQLAVPPDNPAGIGSFADAARPGTKTVVCAEQVPCGAATAIAEQAAGVELTPVSEESSVTDVLGKVTSGEADVGLVYVTDVRRAGDAVLGVDFPEAAGVINTYPIGTLTDAADPDAARAFVELVTGPQGRSVLEAAGFGAP